MIFRFNEEKNRKLISERGIGFAELIADGEILGSEFHPNREKYPNQMILYIEAKNEIYCAPYVIETDGTLFLKTIFPSRKARKKFQ